MRKTIWMTAIAACMTLSAQQSWAEERSVTLHISGMTCGTCPISVRHRAMQMPGVHAATADLQTASATITYEDREQSAQAIAQAITDLGYPAVIAGSKQ